MDLDRCSCSTEITITKNLFNDFVFSTCVTEFMPIILQRAPEGTTLWGEFLESQFMLLVPPTRYWASPILWLHSAAGQCRARRPQGNTNLVCGSCWPRLTQVARVVPSDSALMATRQLRQAMYVHPMTIIAQLSNKQISDHRDKTRRHLPPSPLCLSLSLSFSLPIHPIMIILRRRFRVLFSNARSRPVCRSVGRRRGVMRGLATAAAVATTVIGAATAAGVNARPSKPLTRRGY